ncbi:MAG: AzlC family ABC transporter permease [Lachnospiraceae bacterium]|nr:AzlC family ABC transporter permease [Lachnospiraceae bacterium]
MEQFLRGIKDGIPIALGYIAVSFTFGLTAVAGGLSVLQAVLISFMCVTSAGQFAGIEIMFAGGGLVEMAMTQLVINLRYALMSISLSQKADQSMNIFVRLLVGFGVTDEIFAVAVGRKEEVGKEYMYGLIVIPWLSWTLGTLGGAALGSILPVILSEAFGIAIYAMFLAIIIPAGREDKNVIWVILIAASISMLVYYTPLKNFISQGFVIIIASVIASVIGAVLYPVNRENDSIN